MFPGHFAAGLVLKVAEPKAPTLGIMVGVGFLDLVFGVLVPFRIEGGSFAHFDTPWSHSLVMSLIWSAAFAALFWKRGPRVVAVLFAAVFSHWCLDLVSHNPDMQISPYSTIELGYGPLFGGLGGWLELAISAGACAIYGWHARNDVNFGRYWQVNCVLIALMAYAELLVLHKL